MRSDHAITPIVGLTTSEVIELSLGGRGQIVIQEFVDPSISGVTFVRGNTMLIEATVGSCAPILRHGKRGTRWCVDRIGRIRWTSGNGLDDQIVREMAKLQARALADLPRRMNGSMLEWIVADNGALHWVDLKELGEGYISAFASSLPSVYEIGSSGNRRIKQAESISFPITDIAFSKSLPHLLGKRVLCQKGSPLAHLCVAAYEFGICLFVREALD